MERSAFLDRIRGRLGEAPPAGAGADVSIPDDWAVEVDDLIARFEGELIAVGGEFHRATPEGAGAVLAEILDGRAGSKVLLTVEDGVPTGLSEAIAGAGCEHLPWPQCGRAGAASADVGVTSARWAVAETGTVVVTAEPPGGRAPSLLPGAHVAFVPAQRLVATVADLFRRIGAAGELPSNLVLVTGPSKSADIGMELALGVHGPGETHVVIVE